jgi:hypothetical protein
MQRRQLESQGVLGTTSSGLPLRIASRSVLPPLQSQPAMLMFNKSKAHITALQISAPAPADGCVTAVRLCVAAQGPLGEVLDTRQLVSDVSGAGNNWAHGHHVYGPQYHDAILDKIRLTTEDCDSLQVRYLDASRPGGGARAVVGSLGMLLSSRLGWTGLDWTGGSVTAPRRVGVRVRIWGT